MKSMWARVALGCLVAAWMATALPAFGSQPPRIGDSAPEISGTPWINSPPLARGDLRDKVLLVEFWTYG